MSYLSEEYYRADLEKLSFYHHFLRLEVGCVCLEVLILCLFIIVTKLLLFCHTEDSCAAFGRTHTPQAGALKPSQPALECRVPAQLFPVVRSHHVGITSLRIWPCVPEVKHMTQQEYLNLKTEFGSWEEGISLYDVAILKKRDATCKLWNDCSF